MILSMIDTAHTGETQIYGSRLSDKLISNFY